VTVELDFLDCHGLNPLFFVCWFSETVYNDDMIS
jgi:hypothetical protein